MHEAVKYRPLLTPSTIIPTSAIIPDTHDDDIHYYTDVNPKFKLHQRFRKNLKYINCSFNDTTTGEIFVISSVCRKNNGVLPFFKFYDNIKYLTLSPHSVPHSVYHNIFAHSLCSSLSTVRYYSVPTYTTRAVHCTINSDSYSIEYSPVRGIILTFPPPSYIYTSSIPSAWEV